MPGFLYGIRCAGSEGVKRKAKNVYQSQERKEMEFFHCLDSITKFSREQRGNFVFLCLYFSGFLRTDGSAVMANHTVERPV